MKKRYALYVLVALPIVVIAAFQFWHSSEHARFEAMRLRELSISKEYREQFSGELLDRIDEVIFELDNASFPLEPDPKLVSASVWPGRDILTLDLRWLDYESNPDGFQVTCDDGKVFEYSFSESNGVTDRSSGEIVNQVIWELRVTNEQTSAFDKRRIDFVVLIDGQGNPVGNSVRAKYVSIPG